MFTRTEQLSRHDERTLSQMDILLPEAERRLQNGYDNVRSPWLHGPLLSPPDIYSVLPKHHAKASISPFTYLVTAFFELMGETETLSAALWRKVQNFS